MPRSRYKKIILCLSFLLLWLPGMVFGQFGYEKYDDDPYTEYKTFDYYTNPYYNRVEGVVMHGGVILRQTPLMPVITNLQLAYSTRTNKMQYDMGFQQWLFMNTSRRLLLRFNVFRETTTNDHWKIGRWENSLAGIFLHEDFYDHFTVKGYSVAADQKVFGKSLLRILFTQQQYFSLPCNSSFAGSLFDWSKDYRPNPAITEGFERSVSINMLLDERDNIFFPTRGFLLEGKFEKTFGDFVTNGLFMKSVVYYPTFKKQKFVVMGMLGLRKGSIAPQYLMTIGGIGSLRAFPDHYHAGQNFAMYRVTYHFGGLLFQHFPLKHFPSSDATSFAVFWESGNAWYSEKPKKKIYHGIFKPQFLGDAGISLLLADGIVRIDLAKQLINGDGDWRLTFRLFNKL